MWRISWRLQLNSAFSATNKQVKELTKMFLNQIEAQAKSDQAHLNLELLATPPSYLDFVLKYIGSMVRNELNTYIKTKRKVTPVRSLMLTAIIKRNPIPAIKSSGLTLWLRFNPTGQIFQQLVQSINFFNRFQQ